MPVVPVDRSGSGCVLPSHHPSPSAAPAPADHGATRAPRFYLCGRALTNVPRPWWISIKPRSSRIRIAYRIGCKLA